MANRKTRTAKRKLNYTDYASPHFVGFENFDAFLIETVARYCEWTAANAHSYPGHLTAETWVETLTWNAAVLRGFQNREKHGIFVEAHEWYKTHPMRFEKLPSGYSKVVIDPFPKFDELTAEDERHHAEVKKVFVWVSENLFGLWD